MTRAVALLAALAAPLLAASAALAACSTAPRADCRQPVVAGKSSLAFKQTGRTDPDDIYTWRWQAGSDTTVADFGTPLTTTAYDLCIYDASDRPQPVVDNTASAAVGWTRQKEGFSRFSRSSRPLRRLVLKAGPDGKARILAHGDSDTVRQILPFEEPVVVQLQANTGACWETRLAPPVSNDEHRFGATD